MTKALILCGDGINCEEETAFALEQSGAIPTICHINTLLASPKMVFDFPILALPGGFSFGDEVGSGKVLALKLQHALGEQLHTYVSGDHVVIGICNGFQALVKLGVLPQSEKLKQRVTLTHNRQKRFINRWVEVQAVGDTVFFQHLDRFMVPIRHGEGRLMVPEGEENNMKTALKSHIALQYNDDVNGSFLNIAGLTNEKGNVLGLMPHPEAFIRWTQHPAWTSMTAEVRATIPAGKQVFDNMIQALRN